MVTLALVVIFYLRHARHPWLYALGCELAVNLTIILGMTTYYAVTG